MNAVAPFSVLAGKPPGTVARLATFTLASMLAHAAGLFCYALDSDAVTRPASTAAKIFHAALVPGSTAQDPRSRAFGSDASSATSAPADPPASERTADRDDDPSGQALPSPDRWYSAHELDLRAEPMNEPTLTYPAELGAAGIRARVRVRLFIDERGAVRKIEIAQRGPDRLFDTAAIQAWTAVRFTPALRHGVAVKSQKLLEVNFEPILPAG